MVQGRLFFEIAAALIPTLLFGGAVSKAFRPGPWLGRLPERRRRFVFGGVALLVWVVLYGEVLAIDQALSPEISWWKTAYVVTVVAGGTAAVGVVFLRQWMGAPPAFAHVLPWLLVAFVPLAVWTLGDAIADARTTCMEERGEQELAAMQEAWADYEEAVKQAEKAVKRPELTKVERRIVAEATDVRAQVALARLTLQAEGSVRRLQASWFC